MALIAEVISLADDLKFSRHLRAVMWVAEVTWLKKFITALRVDPFYHRTVAVYAQHCTRSWVRRRPPPDDPPAARRAAKRVKSCHESRQARSRDRHCIVSKDETFDVAHLYPLHLTNVRDPQVSTFWDYLNLFFPSSARLWLDEVYPYGHLYYDECRKMLPLSPSAHRYHGLAYFGLKPLDIFDDRRTLRLEFHWLNQDEEYARNRDHKQAPPLICPEHTRRPKASGPNRACLVDHLADEFVSMTSGTIITLTTKDPTSQGLPNFQVLQMQWCMQLLVAAACESLDEVFYGDDVQPVGTNWRYALDDDDDDDDNFDISRYNSLTVDYDNNGEFNPHFTRLFSQRFRSPF